MKCNIADAVKTAWKRDQPYKPMLTGAAAGFVNGLLGAGGGMVLVPLLLYWCKMPERAACATSVAVITPFCLVSAVVYFVGGGGIPPDTWLYASGGLIGGCIGGVLLGKLPVKWIIRAFGAIMVVAGLRMVFA